MSNIFGNHDNDMNEILNRLIKIGEVSSVDPARGTARVAFDDDDSMVSYDLQVLQKNTIANKDYHMPDIGEDVVCIFLPSGSEDGFILGSVYAGEITPPESDCNKRTVVFDDGTKISYDRATHTLTATIGKTSITANQQNITAICTGAANVQATTINLTGNVNINGNVSITGATSITGETSVTGGITATADVVANGAISVATHTHNDSLNKPTTPPM